MAKTLLAEKLTKALEGTKVVKKTAARTGKPPRGPATSSADVPDHLPPLETFKGLQRADLVVVEYPVEPGRVPGIFGAEVVTVSKDGRDAALKFLFPNKPPRAGALTMRLEPEGGPGSKKHRWIAVDAGDERTVTVRRPNKAQLDALHGIQHSIYQRSPDMPPLKLEEVAAFVYPKVTGDGDWLPGVVFGQVSGVDGAKYLVTSYNPDNLEEEPDYAMETVTLERGADGEYTDTTYGCKLAMVRKPTAGELVQFEEARRTVLSRKAIPNMKRPA
jgi:hypothetical protein